MPIVYLKNTPAIFSADAKELAESTLKAAREYMLNEEQHWTSSSGARTGKVAGSDVDFAPVPPDMPGPLKPDDLFKCAEFDSNPHGPCEPELHSDDSTL